MAAEDIYIVKDPEKLTQTLLERYQAGTVSGLYQVGNLTFRLDVSHGVAAYCPLGHITGPAIPQVKAFAQQLNASLFDANEESRLASQKILREGGRELGALTQTFITAEQAQTRNEAGIDALTVAQTQAVAAVPATKPSFLERLGIFGKVKPETPGASPAPVAGSKKTPHSK
ncbi:MAG: hypothetical protein SFW66_01620 [Gammaproteobacteria bacterium]|nr:hypothetical protein [Gammaproteobacteria bacterium]